MKRRNFNRLLIGLTFTIPFIKRSSICKNYDYENFISVSSTNADIYNNNYIKNNCSLSEKESEIIWNRCKTLLESQL